MFGFNEPTFLVAVLTIGFFVIGCTYATEANRNLMANIMWGIFLGGSGFSSLVRSIGNARYPQHADMFAFLDNVLFEVTTLLMISWIVGVVLGLVMEQRRKHQRQQYKKAFPHVDFKEGESIDESLRKYVES